MSINLKVPPKAVPLLCLQRTQYYALLNGGGQRTAPGAWQETEPGTRSGGVTGYAVLP